MEEKWLTWAKQIQAIAQAGLEYSKDKYDKERFQALRDLSCEIMSEYTEVSYDKVKDLFCNESGYQTPKVEVRAAVFKDDKILLVRESIDGKWALPGGWAEYNLSVKENAAKECMEEAGAKVTPIKLISVLNRSWHVNDNYPYGVYKIFVLCELQDIEFKENIETLECGFFELDKLPPLSTERNTEKQVEMCFRANIERNNETIFD